MSPKERRWQQTRGTLISSFSTVVALLCKANSVQETYIQKLEPRHQNLKSRRIREKTEQSAQSLAIFSHEKLKSYHPIIFCFIVFQRAWGLKWSGEYFGIFRRLKYPGMYPKPFYAPVPFDVDIQVFWETFLKLS